MDKAQVVSSLSQVLTQARKQSRLPAPKLPKISTISKVATRMAETLIAMKAVDAVATKLHQLLPKTTEGAEWLHALPSKIANQTIGRIPVLGPIYRWINNAIAEGYARLADSLGMETLAKEARQRKRIDPNAGFNASENIENKGEDEMNKSHKLINAPSFYENLDLHKTFTIPGAYTKKTVINGTLATPKLAVHRIFENPMADKSATIDRLNQKYSLIKAVRGLSATNYNIVDLYNYERFAKLNLLQYYVIKKVVQAAKTYSLVQTGISDNMIASLGFVPSEVRDNLANYETLLCQIHRFITNNLPVSGTWIKRLEYLVGANIPDYSDDKVATIHQFAVSMSSVFYTKEKDHEADSFVFDCIPGAGNNSYATILANFLQYQTAIVNNDAWQQLIADYFGAFGSQAIWTDADYPSYANPLNLRNADNDLCREQIKNAFYVNAKVEIITIDEGVANKKVIIDVDDPTPMQFTGYEFPNTFDYAAYSTARALNYNNLLDNDCYLNVSSGLNTLTQGATNKLLIPDHNGVGAQSITVTNDQNAVVSMNNHETIFTLHKDNYSEGECLEISQFKARSLGIAYRLDNLPDQYYINYLVKTQEYAMMDTTVYVFGSNGTNVVDQTYRICDEVISDDDLQDSESPIDYPDEMMCWALIDWMPLAHFTFFGFNKTDGEYYPRDIACWDIDAFGSLDDRAFATSINYSIYSLQAAGLMVGKKRVDNLGAVYKDKPSKRG